MECSRSASGTPRPTWPRFVTGAGQRGSSRLVSSFTVAMVIVATTNPAMALTLCRKKSGAVLVRETCKRKETVLTLGG